MTILKLYPHLHLEFHRLQISIIIQSHEKSKFVRFLHHPHLFSSRNSRCAITKNTHGIGGPKVLLVYTHYLLLPQIYLHTAPVQYLANARANTLSIHNNIQDIDNIIILKQPF